MKKLLMTAIAAGLLTPVFTSRLNAGGKVIYGDDDRIDYHAMPRAMKTLADSVVSLWQKSDVTFDASKNVYNLSTQKFGDAMGLCKSEKFREQPVGAFCSGSLVGEDMIMTAGHCITNESDCEDTKFVFGFRMDSDSDNPAFAKAEDVYSCSKIVARFLGKEPEEGASTQSLGPDYALIKLDRKVEGRTPLPVNRQNTGLEDGVSLFVVGHPVGLPVKLAGGASVRDASPWGYFVANLDTYGGNSGSPVFNAGTRLIEGILVRGETDFIWKQEDGEWCRVSNVVSNIGGRGEDVTKVSELSEHIPLLPAEKQAAETVENNVIREVIIEDVDTLRGVIGSTFSMPDFR